MRRLRTTSEALLILAISSVAFMSIFNYAIAASLATAILVSAGLLLYFKKRKQ